MEETGFLLEAGVVLGALALAGWLFLSMRQSAIPAFILVGMVARPWVAEGAMVHVLATFGVVLLLFFMGLEFSLGTLLRNRRMILGAGAVDLMLCFPVGLAIGLIFGLGVRGSLLLAGAFYISSSAIIAKGVISLRRSANPETAVGLGILVFEDLFIALFLAILSGAVLVAEPSYSAAGLGIARALLFFGLVLVLAIKGRGLLDWLFDRESDDLFILMVGSTVLLLSWGAVAAGLSEAIGAFLAGQALAETAQKERAERLFAPLEGLFAAIFFLAFGLALDPETFTGLWPYAIPLTLLAVATKLVGGWWAGRRSGLSKRCSLSLGMMLVARGEFSIVLAGIALAVGEDLAGAMIALMVLATSIIGTVTLQVSPELARRVFPRRPAPGLAESGFSPELAAYTGPERRLPAERGSEAS